MYTKNGSTRTQTHCGASNRNKYTNTFQQKYPLALDKWSMHHPPKAEITSPFSKNKRYGLQNAKRPKNKQSI